MKTKTGKQHFFNKAGKDGKVLDANQAAALSLFDFDASRTAAYFGAAGLRLARRPASPVNGERCGFDIVTFIRKFARNTHTSRLRTKSERGSKRLGRRRCLLQLIKGAVLMIERLTDFPKNVLAFACHGRVTRQDYDTVLVPAVRAALESRDKVRIYYETAENFAGIEPGAVWEDFKIGMEHLARWERMAVVTDVEWIKHTIRFFSFLMPGELRIFSRADAAKARDWIVGS
jgi:SpoIIAA-like